MFNRPFVPGQPMPGPQLFGAFDGRTQRSPGGDGFDLLDGNNVFLLGAIAICMFFLNRQMNDDFKKRRKRQVLSVFENQYQKANLETGIVMATLIPHSLSVSSNTVAVNCTELSTLSR